jgi:hypothetical protein
MNLMLSTLVLLAGLTQSSSGAVTTRNEYQLSTSRSPLGVVPPSSNEQVATSIVTNSEDSLISDAFLPAQAQDVLVVPTPDLPAESLTQLTEDLAVMCRIFDKAFPSTRVSTGFTYGDRGYVFGYGMGRQTRGTQGLYLDGYGALFFLYVDYPLAPTEPQEPAEAKAKESADSVWSATVKELSGQPGEDQQAGRSAPAYDPQRVENLKKAAVKTLAHASNIRMRRPQDVITLVVGALDDSRSGERSGRRGPRMGTSTSRVMPGAAGAGPAKPPAGNSAAALLVMRVTKADVDALAQGQLTVAQFTEKVQTISAPISSAAPAAPQPAVPTPPRAGR